MNADPRVYVDAMYDYYCKTLRDTKKIAFSIRQLCFEDAENIYKNYIQGLQNEAHVTLEGRFNTQVKYLRAAITQTNSPVEAILMSDNLDFQPWFRICITTDPNQNIINKYGKKAKQYLTPEIINFAKRQKLDYTRLENL
jgi:hypothetical protein